MINEESKYRKYFNIEENIAYLNSGYMGLLPIKSVSEGSDGFNMKSRSWEIQMDDFYDKPEKARNLFSKLINADSNSVFFTPSASYAFAVFANNFKLNKRKTIFTVPRSPLF